ncbi:MAG TPA: aminotransferase DegT [Desulfovibrio sp.]|uniref:DegT/DnrJ/EryC1/StrS family aminotransferase n=1 Tax=Nitratidesulfovibrio vulgaris TaxID=881 RepID=UPI000E7ECB5C|nr:DegT/DnrJ/EryC1/StrS aminotransferase family protein [Nitratidesulfovibrio vulgaris]WCB46386.1 DegT/DnrJ/EryC1/StrS aminotransferase family protein [Nitratidesulfovibrio vulgaris]HBW17002.1 aminotransferase DegT [Desulfovibrio sp.]
MIPFIDLAAQFAARETAIRSRMDAVLAHGKYIMGPEVRELEQRLAAYIGSAHCVTCASGTDALMLPLMAEGVGPGDAVITTSFTFIATAEVISLLGARPVFVDIEADTWNISPRAVQECLANWNPGWGRPRAIIAVDIFGLPAAAVELRRIADEHGLLLIEDAAQSFGASLDGKRAASFGHYAATSFFPAKPLGCYGDGGAVFCAHAEQAARLDSLRVHGKGTDKYDNVRIGVNSRLDTLQAAIVLAKLDYFDEELAARQQVAQTYAAALAELGDRAILQNISVGAVSAWAQYSLLASDGSVRAAAQEILKSAGIPTAVYYPKPLHLQTAFAHLGYRAGDLPVCENVCSRIFSLPMHPYMPQGQAKAIAAKAAAALA